MERRKHWVDAGGEKQASQWQRQRAGERRLETQTVKVTEKAPTNGWEALPKGGKNGLAFGGRKKT